MKKCHVCGLGCDNNHLCFHCRGDVCCNHSKMSDERRYYCECVQPGTDVCRRIGRRRKIEIISPVPLMTITLEAEKTNPALLDSDFTLSQVKKPSTEEWKTTTEVAETSEVAPKINP